MYNVGTIEMEQIGGALIANEESVDVSNFIIRGRIARAVFQTSRNIFASEAFDEPFMSGSMPVIGLARAELNVFALN